MSVVTHLAAVLSIGAAFSLVTQSLFLRLSTRDGDPADAALIVISVNLLVLFPSIVILYFPDYGLTSTSVASFTATGTSGTVISRLLKYTNIIKIGARRTEPITATNALFATTFGVVFLDETLTLSHGIGILLINVGVSAIA
ncbi:EamA family transporter [Natrinema gelatinilyticum]|uniref:EamA family transporter n=1 Tax=Natrinema gelatinilyticum TaxID=2961571 RepID=UPI0020C1C3FF|nr:EamA family transporter [Natrinema gelatinilyticum]